MGMALPLVVSPAELQRLLDSGHRLVVLDVREPEEVAVARLKGSLHIPMGDIPGRLHELDPDADIVVYCHHGIRSASVAAFLTQREFTSVANLSGGIDAWSQTVDPSVPRY
jgi:rhodanese-related sulfurtransferase